MFIIKTKLKVKENQYEIEENMAYLKVMKKDGTVIDAKIDTSDLERVLEKGGWFAEWNKDFNNYIVQRLSDCVIDGKKYKGKQALQNFILDVHPKAPVRNCNGDTLDNRKENLEIYNSNSKNDYKVLDENNAAVILRDKYGRENGKTIIDKSDLDKVINSGLTWVYYRKADKPYAVANSKEGRVYLNRFIMNTPEEMITHHKNLNTLDNRKSNLENLSLEVEDNKQ